MKPTALVLWAGLLTVAYLTCRFYMDREYCSSQTDQECHPYHCSPLTHLFGMGYPLLVVLYVATSSTSWVLRYVILALSISMFGFHLMYHIRPGIIQKCSAIMEGFVNTMF